MGALNAWIVSRIRGSMKVVFALAVIITCVAANGSMPTIAEREVDIIPEDEELIQAKADEMSLVQAESGFQNEVAKMGNDGQSTGILGVDVNTGAQQTVVINPMDAPGSDNQGPTEDITTSERSQRAIANGGDPSPTVDRQDAYPSEISKTNPSQSVLNPKFNANEARAGHGVADAIANIQSKSAEASVSNLYSI